MKSIAVFNQKGGVGKTTSVVNIAAFLEKKYGKKVLVVDCDSQCNTTDYLMINYDEPAKYTVTSFLKKKKKAKDIAVRALVEYRGKIRETEIYLIPGDMGVDMVNIKDTGIMKKMLDEVRDGYDYCLFDCPANLSNMTLCTLSAADYVIVPATPAASSLKGYGLLLDTVQQIRAADNVGLKIMGVFFNFVDSNRTLAEYIIENNKEALGTTVFETTIRRSEDMLHAEMYGRPICYYRPRRPVAKDYEKLTEEILSRMGE